MNDEQENILNKFIKETRENFGHIFDDRTVDHALMEKIFGQDGIGGLKNEMHLHRLAMEDLTRQLKSVKKEVGEQPSDIAKEVVDNLEAIQESQTKKQNKGSLLNRILRRRKPVVEKPKPKE